MESLKYIFISMRPKQWLKNGFVFAALVFSLEFYNTENILLSLQAFILFSLVAGAVYIFNDIADFATDKKHIYKKNRPLPSGKIDKKPLFLAGGVVAVLAIAGSFWLNQQFGIIILSFFFLQIAYSLFLKNILFIDIITVVLGFVLRVVAGAVVIQVVPSVWLIISTFFLSLFLIVSKREQEYRLILPESQRKVLRHYSLSFFHLIEKLSLVTTFIIYSLYTFNSPHTNLLALTIPVVLYGLLRYHHISHNKKQDNDGPTENLLSDKPILITVAIWIIMIFAILLFIP